MAQAPTAQSLTYLGTMTGTSLDGLDLALLQVGNDDSLQISDGQTLPLPNALRDALQALTTPGDNEIDRLGEADRYLGEFIGHSICDYLQSIGVAPESIRAIGSHGQTIRHRPQAARPFTLQIGDPNCIAEITGIDTVGDFRRRDMAAAGQGAPLAPLFHQALFADLLQTPDSAIAVVNIGGISNLSLLRTEQDVLGFDSGPGNGLLDAWIARHRGQPFDKDGQWAQQGQSDGRLLEELLADPYFALPPPKSTGREYFSLDWLDAHPRVAELDPEQVQATLVDLTAAAIAADLTDTGLPLERLLVCGGGRSNPHLLRRLQSLCPVAVASTDEMGVDGDSLEAAAFAWLAHRRLQLLPGNAPSVTGAHGARVLGSVYPGC